MKTILPILFMLAIGVAAEPEAKTFTASDGTELPYRYSAPTNVEEGKKYPLVIYLHGSGSRGSDNKAQLRQAVDPILGHAEKLKQPIFLIAPQCPLGTTWLTSPRTGKDAPGKSLTVLDAVFELTDEISWKQPVDSARIYITGLSMGGHGTWGALAKKPDLFAAAIPICGGGDPKTADLFKHVPIQIFHGADDKVVPPGRSQEMFDALQRAGSQAKLTIYPGVEHDSWTQTYANEEVIRWLFNQTKSK